MTDTNSAPLSECFIVGGGPSLRRFDWTQLDGKFVIAINRAYQQLPNADIVYFTDLDWYTKHRAALNHHAGQKIKGSVRPTNSRAYTEYLLTSESGLQTTAGQLAHGHNSTYAAINLAAIHLKFTTIYLLGVDMQHDGGRSHWHDGHPRIDPESAYEKMLTNFDKVAPMLRDLNVQVFNINTPEQSRLRCFPFSDRLLLGTGPEVVDPPLPEQPVYRVNRPTPKVRINADLMQLRRQRISDIQRTNDERRKNSINNPNQHK